MIRKAASSFQIGGAIIKLKSRQRRLSKFSLENMQVYMRIIKNLHGAVGGARGCGWFLADDEMIGG